MMELSPFPIIKNRTILSWCYQTYDNRPKEMLQYSITIDLRIINGASWIVRMIVLSGLR